MTSTGESALEELREAAGDHGALFGSVKRLVKTIEQPISPVGRRARVDRRVVGITQVTDGVPGSRAPLRLIPPMDRDPSPDDSLERQEPIRGKPFAEKSCAIAMQVKGAQIFIESPAYSRFEVRDLVRTRGWFRKVGAAQLA